MSNGTTIRRALASVTVPLSLLALAPIAQGQCDQIPACQLVWSDEFNGSAVDLSKWEFQLGDGTSFGIPGWGNDEKQWYQTSNASVANGMLTIQAREESVGGYQYTSSRLRSLGKGDFLYGRFEMRARLPMGQGMWPAFWMLPSDPTIYGVWAASGEIDVMEQIGGSQIFGTIHYGDSAPGNIFSGGTTFLPAGTENDFHVYAVEWEPTEIRWYFDGQLYSTEMSWHSTGGPYPAPFDADFHLLLNLAVGGNFPGDPDPSTVFPQEYVVDYVRVYQQPPPDPEKAARCESAKAKAAGKKAKCVGNVFARAIKKTVAAETFKLLKCSTKFNSAFARAEEKAEGSCPSSGDAASVEAQVEVCIDGVVSDLGGVPGPGGDQARCQSKKTKQAGKYAFCRFKTLSKAIKKGLVLDFAKCEDRLSTRWAKIETLSCSTVGDLVAVKADLDACHATISGGLSGPGCGNGIVDLGEECDDGNTAGGDGCSDQCEFESEYEQNFETLAQSDPNALANDGWQVFGNVFDGTNGNYLYGYGPFPAPNGGPAFCAVDVGQGGPLQGGQHLSVYSDYNNGDHANGHTIESNVFQERSIVAGDVGNTLTLVFDAKLGNLTGSSTALAFIKTLDPNNNFALTNFVSADTTSLPSAWTTHSISLAIDAGLVGQILQYGFANNGTSYEGSGVFYDNVAVVVTSTL